MAIAVTMVIIKNLTIPSPLLTDHLLVSHPPKACPDAKVKPISQLSFPLSPKSIKAATEYIKTTVAFMTLDFMRVKWLMEDNANSIRIPVPACIKPP